MADTEAVALKYLELARGEILEKVRFVNQTLGAYLLGTSAIAAWFYQLYKPTTTVATSAPKDLAAVGLAAMLSYIALGVSWIIHHNERIVTALARYQKDDLFPFLEQGPPMWEASDTLRDRDGWGRSTMTIAVQQMIILTPPMATLFFAFAEFHQLSFWLFAIRLVALVATLANIVIAVLTGWDRFWLRRDQ